MQCLFEQNVKDNNVIHQATQSANKGRLELVEAQAYGQSAQIGLDGDQVLTRLPQAG